MSQDTRSPAEVLALFPDVWPTILMLDAGRYLLFGLAAAILINVFRKPLAPRRIQNRIPSSTDRRREFAWSLLTSVIFSLNGFFLVFGLAQLGLADILRDSPAWLILVHTLGLIVAHDAWFYWIHRAMHWRPLFRAAHITHHRSRTPSPWAAYAFAPLEAVLEALFLPIYLLILPADGIAIFIFLMHMLARNVIGHCGYEFLPAGWIDWKLTRWMTTPTHHDMHHQHGRFNYGLYFTFWDRLMGTEHPEYRTRFLNRADACRRAQDAAPAGIWSG
ncbi:MAG: sterol desaturase family protein [Minwuia sp.]|uniref:sterol desaturase family protein n=1 Tax=Minwuia sp. TaxID=2493630 RepID=UPI003A886EAE